MKSEGFIVEAPPSVAEMATVAIHGGRVEDHVPMAPSIVTGSSFIVHPDAVGFSASDLRDDAPYVYGRWSNPTVALLERRLAMLEGGAAAACFASGMAAATALFFHRLKSGDHLVFSNVSYAGVAELAHEILPKYGIEVSAVDSSDLADVQNAVRPGRTRLVHIETPANPTLRLADIGAIASITHEAGAELSVDSTIATPLATQPLALGADYVVHSLTKYICGHGDAIGGAVVGRDARSVRELRREAVIHLGGVMSPFVAWLNLRGIETLPLRMAAHEANARRVAEFLESHPRVARVYWPGLRSHPQHELAQAQMRNFSGLLAFTVRGDGRALARVVAERARVISYAVSLGKTKSLIFYVPTEDLLRSSFRVTGAAAEAYRAWAGQGVFRMSVGLENFSDLIADLDRMLA